MPLVKSASLQTMKAQASKGPLGMILGGLALAALSSVASFPLGAFAGIALAWFGTSLHSFQSRRD
jgi:ABC-type phosphate transport system permease subunit